MLGSFGNSSGNNGWEPLYDPARSNAATAKLKKHEQSFAQLLDREWSELPYAMMRLTAARRPWDANRVYWRDRIVQLGNIDLNLAKTRASDDASRYMATYRQDELRRDFPLQPSLENDQLRWSAPGISDVHLTTEQLAEKLLSRLVTFYSGGLSPAPTSSASPNLSS